MQTFARLGAACAILCLTLIATSAHATDPAHSPTVFDTWGFELLDWTTQTKALPGVVKTASGDTVLVYRLPNEDNSGFRYERRDVYTGERREISYDKYLELVTERGLRNRSTLNMGSTTVSFESYCGSCGIFDQYVTITDKATGKRQEAFIFYVSDRKLLTNYFGYSKLNASLAADHVSTPFLNVLGPSPSFHQLDDGSFLLLSDKANLVLRLNRDLTTHFEPQGSPIVIVPKRLVDDLFFSLGDTANEQTLSDKLNHVLTAMARHQKPQSRTITLACANRGQGVLARTHIW